jgi:predicted nucleic acid-binding protein
MKLLFIDSNALLNFYDFHDEDLDQLNKLVDLIDSGEIKLYLPTQVIHEVKKNRDLRLSDAYEKFSSHNSNVPMPLFCKSYEEYSDIKRAQKILNKLKSKLSQKILTDIQSSQLKADLLIELLEEKSEIIDSDQYLEKAIQRHRLGRPPGKKNRSYGDEIIWESLIHNVTQDGDFIIVSQDGDYASALDKNELKNYLLNEWNQNKTNDIYLYRNLTSFFAEHDIKIELQIEKEKDELIRDLVESPNFSFTHSTISKLNKFSSLTDDQLFSLVTALFENNQVSWISLDPDVNSFYKKHFADKSDKFDSAIWKKIREHIWSDAIDDDLEAEISALKEKVDSSESTEINDASF